MAEIDMVEIVARAVAIADWRSEIDEFSEKDRWEQAADAYDLTNNNGRARYDDIARAAIETITTEASKYGLFTLGGNDLTTRFFRALSDTRDKRTPPSPIPEIKGRRPLRYQR